MRAVLLHPLGPTLLVGSLLLAGAMRLLPGLDRWSALAPWILFWGLLGYTVAVVALLRSRSDAFAVAPDESSSIGQSVVVELSETAIKRWLLWDAVQHLASLLTLGAAVASAGYLLLLAPSLGGYFWVTILLILSVLIAVGSFIWHYVVRYGEQYEIRVQKLLEIQDRSRALLEQVEERRLHEALEKGFEAAVSARGIKALQELDEAYSQLQPVSERRRDTDPLAIVHIPALATEAYRRGLSVLADALELMHAVHEPSRDRLEAEIAQLERESDSTKADDSQTARTKMRRETLDSHRERLRMLDQLQLRLDQLLYQASRCEASLHSTRIDLAAIKTDGSETSVNSVIEALQETSRRAKEVQEELKRLGF